MLGFFASLSPFGWLLLLILALGLFFLPRLLRGEGKSTLPERQMQPGEDRPDSGSHL